MGCALPQRTKYGFPDMLLREAAWSMNDSAEVTSSFLSRYSYLTRRWSTASAAEYHVPLRLNVQLDEPKYASKCSISAVAVSVGTADAVQHTKTMVRNAGTARIFNS